MSDDSSHSRSQRHASGARWMGRGIWTIGDQALFAGANFVVNILLARWLSPEGYGAYTVAYTVFLLLGTLHAGGIVEPMLVFGAGRFESRLKPYLRILLTWHGRFALVAGALLGLAGAIALVAGLPILGHALLALAIGQALILFQWAMRSACYIRTQPQLAATTGILYATLMLGGAFVAQASGWLNEATAIGLMAGASGAAGVVIAFRLGIPLRRGDDAPLAQEARREHRRYGGWATATGALEWFHGFLPFLLLPIWAGLEATGQLRALFNLVLPVLHVFHALALLVVPVLVRARVSGTFKKTGTLIGAGMGALALIYAVVILVLGPWAMDLLYDGKYNGVSNLLWLVALLGPILAVSNVAQALLRSQERPEAVFVARAGASGVAATVGALCVWAFGVMGALIADVLAAATESVVMVWKLWRPSPEAPAAPERAPGREHVLVVAFACSPGRGSEPGQGWQLASRLAAHHDVTVLTYSGFRHAIEAELCQRPIPGLSVAYHHLPRENARHWRDGTDRPPGAREQAHYYLWQVTARRVVRRLHREDPFTIAHHVSFMRYWSPSAAAAPGVPFLWGPVGGGESAPEAFYAAFSPRGRRSARLRDYVRRLAHRDPYVRHTAACADLALATTEESAEAMRALGAAAVRVSRASVALGDDEIARLATIPPPVASGDGASIVRFATVGRLLHWKGYDLALRAFAEATTGASGAMRHARLDVIGDGPERAHLEALAAELGVTDCVSFHGHIPRDRCLGLIGEADVMVHPSLHDSGGYATLEAMAVGRPVICLALGGPGLQVDAEVGVAVPAHSPEQVVADLARAFTRLGSDPGLRRAMGARGRARVSERYRWSVLVDDILGHYRALARPSTPLAFAAVSATPRSDTVPSDPSPEAAPALA